MEKSLKVEAIVNQEWEQQGPICTLTEFLDVNQTLAAIDKEKVIKLHDGDKLILNLGAAGIYKITRVA